MAFDVTMKNLNKRFAKMQFGTKQRERVYLKLASFLRNGVTLSNALRIMWSHASDDGIKPSNPTAQIIQEWIKKIDNGQPFSKAVEGWVPENDRIILDAGEKAGGLEDAIKNALYIQKAGKAMTSAIIGGMAYPVLLVVMALGFLIMFGVRIVPAFEDVLPRDKWTGLAADMATVSDFVKWWLMPLMVGFLCGMFAIFYTLPRWVGPLRARFDHYPPWSLYRLKAGAGFMLSVSALVKAGVQIPEILRILMRGAPPWYEERMAATLRYVSNGTNLGEALYRTRLGFPDSETVKDLRAYAELEGFDDTLEALAKQWIEESVEKIKNQTAILRNVAFIVLGIVFAIIASGIFSMQQQVTQSL